MNRILKAFLPAALAFSLFTSSSLHAQSLDLKVSYSELEGGKVATRENVNLPTAAQFIEKKQQIVAVVDVSIFEQN